ncbi:unnamed protein product [Rhizophagus irregularis]|nr:unnamed protein product [Rhizophagus irregularis]CAB5380842.1 unnamed protein product [Rhizophagus irregularis]
MDVSDEDVLLQCKLNHMNEGLSKEKLEKIIALQVKYDIEIKNLAAECNLEPEFIKIFVNQRLKNLERTVAGMPGKWNVNVKSSGVQKKCAIEWNELDLDIKEQYFQTADEINKSRSLNKTELIEDINKRKNELNKQIKELRKIYRMIHVSCGVDLLTICVSNTDDINSTCFGTTIGEEFYAQCNTLDQILTLFQSFSILEKAERNKMLGNIDTSQSSHYVTQHNQYVSVNNRKTRDEVRCILREKFRKATGKETIPYKNWPIQDKYLVHGWPSEVEFMDYAKLSESDKVKVLSALNNINFSENQNKVDI